MMANPSPRQGSTFANVATATTLRVPKIGIRNMFTSRNVPPANPGMAVSQNNCISVNLKPIPGRRTAIALITNHVANANTNEMVVMVSVRQAMRLPVSSQNAVSSGRQSVRKSPLDAGVAAGRGGGAAAGLLMIRSLYPLPLRFRRRWRQ